MGSYNDIKLYDMETFLTMGWLWESWWLWQLYFYYGMIVAVSPCDSLDYYPGIADGKSMADNG